MKKHISYDKLSKKARKEEDKKKRSDWGAINPVSRVVPDKRREQSRRACRGYNGKVGE